MPIKVIYGPNASGKTLMVDRMPKDRYLAFRDAYGSADAGYYHQQRWNSCEYDEVPLVRDSLGECRDAALWGRISGLFGLDELMDKPLILLSSGELRKFQLARALRAAPRSMVIDNPFIGLDAPSRELLDKLLRALSDELGLELTLVVSRESDIPSGAGEVVRLQAPSTASTMVDKACGMVRSLGGHIPDYEEVVRLNKVSIRFGERTILRDLDWVVKAGEKWALEGRNGSGKSTLLSIICADIPQAYACDVSLFGRQRGTGESIWDIKKHIGFVSPELHRGFCRNVPVLDVVANGLHDRNGMYVATSDSDVPLCEFWMDVFGIRELRDRSFMKISSGEQRLALLARAFVKDPELLILDEPLHGLDDANRARVRSIIDAFCSRSGKTLIMVSHYQDEFPSCIDHNLSL